MNELYEFHQPITAGQILEKAAEILEQRCIREESFGNPNAVKDYLKYKMCDNEREVFAVLLLDNQHRLISYEELFYGTVNAASVYPREVVKKALEVNAAAIILAHNHPSGIAEPSQADRSITTQLVDALNLIDVRVLDHIVVGEEPVSFAERGWV